MKLLLTMTSLAAIIGMAMPAHADSTDDAFIASLQAADFTFSDRDRAIAAGKYVCQAVAQGTQMADVAKKIQSDNPKLSEDKAAKFTAIAANAYCPEAVSTVSAPSSAPISAPSRAPSRAPSSAPSSAPRSTLTP